MREWNLRIELKSDFCTATGENAPGMISSKTALEFQRFRQSASKAACWSRGGNWPITG